MKLANQHIFVTGGANGIGAAIVRDVALAGARVSFVDIDVDMSETFIKELRAEGYDVAFARANVGDFVDLEQAYESLVGQFGNVNGVVNNASVNSCADPVEMTDEQWDDFFAVDLKAIWYTAKLALPAMRAAHRGSIVNIGSIHESRTYPNVFPLSAAKSAVMGLTRNLGVDEGQHNIRTNMLSYGYSVPPHKIAKVVTFLLSDDASFVNGSDWPVDGGLSPRSA
jgi:NAD(P)-dependent dehydrogenase (short-subunit alcohol dehydrogenase family)